MNAPKIIEGLKANPELGYKDVKKFCHDSASFGILRKCVGDKRFNDITNMIINEKLTKQEVKDKFFKGKGAVAGRLFEIAAQLKTCELINVKLPKTKIEKLEKKKVRESYKHAIGSPLYRTFCVIKVPNILRGAHMRAAQEMCLDLVKKSGAKEPELVFLADRYLEYRGRQA